MRIISILFFACRPSPQASKKSCFYFSASAPSTASFDRKEGSRGVKKALGERRQKRLQCRVWIMSEPVSCYGLKKTG